MLDRVISSCAIVNFRIMLKIVIFGWLKLEYDCYLGEC